MAYTAFGRHTQLGTGSLEDVALAARAWFADTSAPVAVFSDATGAAVDLDLRGDDAQVLARLEVDRAPPKPRRGRPRLGVVSREISLLPRHWDWLRRQARSASATLRRLVELQLKAPENRARRAAEVAYGPMSVLAGDLPGFEEASRALFALDLPRLREHMRPWPEDVRAYVWRLAAVAPDAPDLVPTREAGRAFVSRGLTGPVVMLNLLRYREIADYTAAPELAPPEPISGAEAYGLYLDHTRPLLERAGGSLDYAGTGGALLVGPTDERWDLALLVRHRSVEDFLAFATDEAYLAGAGHRTAALADARLLPLVDGLPDAMAQLTA